MKLYTPCKSCGHEISIKSFAATRSDLEKDKGEILQLNCPECGTNQERHVNDVKAKASKYILIGAIIISVLVTAILWTILGAIGTVSGTIPVLAWVQERKAVKAFNSYKVRKTKEAKY
ncbi:MAG: hypothetical protein AAFO07_31440 [Bacteroidota bacterium]